MSGERVTKRVASMEINRRKFLWWGVLAAAGLTMPPGLTACSGQSQSQNNSSSNAIKMGVTSGAMSDVPLHIADKSGYFEEQDLKVTFTPFQSAAKAIAPLGSGQLQVAVGAPSAGLYNAVARGTGLKIVADKGRTPEGYGYEPLMIRRDLIESGKFKSFKDLKGLETGVVAQGANPEVILNGALQKGGLKWGDANVNYIGFPQQVQALQNKSIEAAVIVEPLAAQAVQKGAAIRFAGTDELIPNMQLANILYSSAFVKNNPETGKKFMIAYLKGVRDYNDALKYNDAMENAKLKGPNADKIISTLTEFTGVDDPDIYRKAVPPAIDPNGEMNVENLRQQVRFWKDNGSVDNEVTVETVNDTVDRSFADAAAKELGPYQRKQ